MARKQNRVESHSVNNVSQVLPVKSNLLNKVEYIQHLQTKLSKAIKKEEKQVLDKQIKDAKIRTDREYEI